MYKAPSIFHLLFADDSFISKAKIKEALSLEQIKLLSAVGLKINYQKSIMTFGLQLCIS